ncbi:3'-5' exonuclease [Streptomyces luteogriseus]|uniref:3'-5' exonuclease n=1 Tax=Streptomyces luteogriseus TaxID=68233 RepID=UPI0035948048
MQITAVDGEGRTVLKELLDPRRSITAAASALHCITRSDVACSPCFGDVFPQLTGILGGKRYVAYNVGFDGGVLARELMRHLAAALPAGFVSVNGHRLSASLNTTCWRRRAPSCPPPHRQVWSPRRSVWWVRHDPRGRGVHWCGRPEPGRGRCGPAQGSAQRSVTQSR